MVTQNHFVIVPATVLEKFKISEGVTVTAQDCTKVMLKELLYPLTPLCNILRNDILKILLILNPQ